MIIVLWHLCLSPTPDLHVFISLWCNYSDERIQYFITHAQFTLLVQCMEFTLSYYDVTFCTTWCTKTCHLMLLFLTDTCSSYSNDNIVLESRKSYWVDYLSNQLFFFFYDPLHLFTNFWTGLYENYWKIDGQLGTQRNVLAYKRAEPQR